MKTTEWYSWRVNPVRVGWYQTSIVGNGSRLSMLYWNGHRWLTAKNGRRLAFCFPNDKWLGLTEPV